jgi:hypothetical protein
MHTPSLSMWRDVRRRACTVARCSRDRSNNDRFAAAMAADHQLPTPFAAAATMEVDQPAEAKVHAILGSSFSGESRNRENLRHYEVTCVKSPDEHARCRSLYVHVASAALIPISSC